MPAPALDRRASVWRMANNPLGGQPGQAREVPTQVIPSVRCAIVPVSAFTAEQSYARESTHVIWVEPWLTLRLQDEVVTGRRDADDYNDVQPERYRVNGRRTFTAMGVIERAYYVRTLE